MSDVDANAYLSQNDYLTWSVWDAMKHSTQMNEDPDMLVYCIILINFAVISSFTFTSAETLLDIYSSSLLKGFISSLCEEVKNLIHKKSDDWTKNDVDNLICINSAIKENMCLKPLMIKVLECKVVSKDSVILKDNLRLSQEVNIASLTYSVHCDESIYLCAHQYDVFCFLHSQKKATSQRTITSHQRVKKNSVMKDDRAHALNDATHDKNSEVAFISETFLTFSHSCHAWYAFQQAHSSYRLTLYLLLY